MAGYTMVSAGRCVALGYGTLALFVAYIVFDIWCARNPDALAWNVTGTWSSTEANAAGPAAENSEGAQLPLPAHVELEPAAALSEAEPTLTLALTATLARLSWLAWNVTDPWHPLYTRRIPVAENSENAKLPSPAQLQLEPSAAPAEEEPAEPLLVALRYLVVLGLVGVIGDAVEVVHQGVLALVPNNGLVDLLRFSVVLPLFYALLWCDHLDHRSVVEAAALPMMAWSLRVELHEELMIVMTEGTDKLKGVAMRIAAGHVMLSVQISVVLYAVLRCLGFLWLAPGSTERHALDLIGIVLYAGPFGGCLVFRTWWRGGLQSWLQRMALLPLFFSPLVHLYVSPPSA